METQLNQVDTDVYLETSKLERLKSGHVNILHSPLLRDMFYIPPAHTAKTTEESETNNNWANILA